MTVAVRDDDDENTIAKKDSFCAVQIKRGRMSGVGGLNLKDLLRIFSPSSSFFI